MEVIQKENMKVPNSLPISGLSGDVVDNEVMDYLAVLGSIGRIVKITTDDPQFKDSAIVEFTSGEPIQFISASLPCLRPTGKPDVTHHIQLLSEVYCMWQTKAQA